MTYTIVLIFGQCNDVSNQSLRIRWLYVTLWNSHQVWIINYWWRHPFIQIMRPQHWWTFNTGIWRENKGYFEEYFVEMISRPKYVNEAFMFHLQSSVLHCSHDNIRSWRSVDLDTIKVRVILWLSSFFSPYLAVFWSILQHISVSCNTANAVHTGISTF